VAPGWLSRDLPTRSLPRPRTSCQPRKHLAANQALHGPAPASVALPEGRIAFSTSDARDRDLRRQTPGIWPARPSEVVRIAAPQLRRGPLVAEGQRGHDRCTFLTVAEAAPPDREARDIPVELSAHSLCTHRGPGTECLATFNHGLRRRCPGGAHGAPEADIMRGAYRGRLQGIPYGLNDTYGVWPSRDREFADDESIMWPGLPTRL